jgi:hypothetical protein
LRPRLVTFFVEVSTSAAGVATGSSAAAFFPLLALTGVACLIGLSTFLGEAAFSAAAPRRPRLTGVSACCSSTTDATVRLPPRLPGFSGDAFLTGLEMIFLGETLAGLTFAAAARPRLGFGEALAIAPPRRPRLAGDAASVSGAAARFKPCGFFGLSVLGVFAAFVGEGLLDAALFSFFAITASLIGLAFAGVSAALTGVLVGVAAFA